MSSIEEPDSRLLPLPQQQQHQTIQEEEEEQIKVYSVTDGLKSKHTKVAYNIAFSHFLKVTVKGDDLRALLDTKQNVIESKIIDHVKYLKDVEKLKYRSILVHLQAIFHFFEINDYNNNNLNRRKIRRFLPEDESDHYARDRPYSIKEIEQILSTCDIRARVAVLLMASTGTRIGGLRELQLGDIRKVDEFGIYLIWVYNRSGKYRYYTFCTPECATAIDEYLAYRKRSGEQLSDKSPLIRDKYGIDNPFTPPAKFLSIRATSSIFEDVLKKTGINQPAISKLKWQKREVMRSHGFRKFFINQCIRAGLTESTWKPLVGHKLPKTDASYIRTTEEERLAKYVKAIDLLTIDPTKRLQQEVEDLQRNQKQEIDNLKTRVQELDEWARRWKRFYQIKVAGKKVMPLRYWDGWGDDQETQRAVEETFKAFKKS